MAKATDSEDRKASAAAADDESVFKVTPFGRRRRAGWLGRAMHWVVHFAGFPFFYVYNQLRDRRRSAPQKWSDAGHRHGVAPASAADPAPKG